MICSLYSRHRVQNSPFSRPGSGGWVNPKEEFDNLNRNLALVPTGEKEIQEDLSAHLWMQRNDGDPIRIVELHGLRDFAEH